MPNAKDWIWIAQQHELQWITLMETAISPTITDPLISSLIYLERITVQSQPQPIMD